MMEERTTLWATPALRNVVQEEDGGRAGHSADKPTSSTSWPQGRRGGYPRVPCCCELTGWSVYLAGEEPNFLGSFMCFRLMSIEFVARCTFSLQLASDITA